MHLNVEVEPNAGRIWFKKPPLVCFMLTSAYFCKWISRYFTPPPNNIYFSSARAFKLRFFFPSATRKLHGQRNWCGEQLSAPCKRYEGLFTTCSNNCCLLDNICSLKKTKKQLFLFLEKSYIKWTCCCKFQCLHSLKTYQLHGKSNYTYLDVLEGRPGL